MRQNPERLAWTVLIISFIACLALTISTPLLVRWWIDAAHVSMQISSSVQQGTVQLTCGNETVPTAMTQSDNDVCLGFGSLTALTLSGDQGMFVIKTRDVPPRPVAKVQIGQDTRMSIVYAHAPRFSISSQPYMLVIRAESGRVRVSTASTTTRPIVVQINTPQALIQMNNGSAIAQVNSSETQVDVYDGTALVVWKSKSLGVPLERFQSVSVPPPDGALRALPAAQDLVANGSFELPLEPAWQIYSKDIEIEGESGGQVIVGANSNNAIGFTRAGVGHAEIGMTQVVGQDVRGVESLQLQLVLRVLEQDVPVCGTQGTECPVMAKIEYEDSEGNQRSWVQGFYASQDPTRLNPPYCTICSPRADHLRVEKGEWYVYNSPNLIPLLSQAGPPAVRLRSITLYASGHTFQSTVSQVELIAR